MLRSLRTRIFAIVIGLATLPVLILGLADGHRNLHILEAQSYELQDAIATRIESEISAFIRLRLDELSVLDRIQLLATMPQQELTAILNRLLGHEQVFQSLVIHETGGRVLARASRTGARSTTLPAFDIEHYRQLSGSASAQAETGHLYYDDALREPLLGIYQPIMNRRSGEIVRILAAEVRLKPVWNLLAGLSLPGTTEAYLVDAAGQVLAHRLAATVLTGTTIRLDSQAHTHSHSLFEDPRLLTVNQRLSSTREPAFVVVTRRAEDALAAATATRYLTLIAAGIIMLISASVAVLFSRQIFRPIESLASSARRISAGELHVPAEVTGPAEIQELGEAFNHMTERLAAMIEELEHSAYAERQRAMVTLESIGDAVITTDEQGLVRYMNPVAQSLTGWSLEDAQGKPLKSVFDIINEHTRAPAPDPVARCLAEGRIHGLANHTVLRSRDRREYAIQDSAAPIKERDGRLIGAVMVFSDVTAARARQREISHQARHDPLTGLVNRREFEARLKRVLTTAKSEPSEHALCYLDLDQFKVINDTCGHAAGDELLRQLAELFHRTVRQRDTLGRLGGDEFAVLMEHCGLDQAWRVANALRRSVAEMRFVWEDNAFPIGVSIGVVAIDGEADTVDTVLRAADTACYLAKEGGRNRVHVYRENDTAVTRRQGEMRWVGTLTKALEENRFELHAQNIVALDGHPQPQGAREHIELLLRLVDSTGERILPTAFLPAAERYNLITKIDRWVIQSTVDWLAQRRVADVPMLCSINISGASIGEGEFLDFVLGCFESSRIPGASVCFEITETAAIGNLSMAVRFIQAIRRLGCRLALDDFGSGLSSFAYLRTLEVDYLKIDGAFVRDMVQDPVHRAMVRSINDVGQVLGVKTIAEYVESKATLDMLTALGVNSVQGHYLGEPEPLIAA